MYPYTSAPRKNCKNSNEYKEKSISALKGEVDDSCSENNNSNYNGDYNDGNMGNDNQIGEDSMPSVEEYIKIMLQEAIINECTHAKHYKILMDKISDEHDKSILNKIYLGTKKHQAMFSEIYCEVSGNKFEGSCEAPEVNPSLLKNFEESIFSNLDDSETYRRLYFAFLNIKYRDWLYEIISDKQNYASEFNYLYSKYK